MSEEFGIEVEPYDGPEYISNDLSCDVCRKKLTVRIIGNLAVTCKVTWYIHHEDGVDIECICEDCSYPLSDLLSQIANYNHTGDPDDDSWLDNDGEIYE